MSGKIVPRTYKGTRDFLPQQMVRRQYVIRKIVHIFEKYGFEPLETPAIELMETLGGKYGEEGDRLLYRFTDRGNREVGLRYDLTVPMARVVAMYPELPKPFKRYQIQPVWRADKPQKGRFREFYQCDVDIVGTSSMVADAEIIAIIDEVLRTLQFDNFVIRINNRKFLRSFIIAAGLPVEKEADVIRIIDKLDKIGLSGVEKELEQLQIGAEAVKHLLKILDFDGDLDETFVHAEKQLGSIQEGQNAIRETKQLFEHLSHFGVPSEDIKLDLFLARGLDYYTGPIFESVVKEPKIGSVTGGGRYDNLIGLFSRESLPAVGSSVGLERIITVMEELGMFPDHLKTPTRVLVTVFDQTTLDFSLNLASDLRKADIPTSVYLGDAKLRGQLGYAAEKGIPIVLIAGPDEIRDKKITVKNMMSGEQTIISLPEVKETVKKILGHLFQD